MKTLSRPLALLGAILISGCAARTIVVIAPPYANPSPSFTVIPSVLEPNDLEFAARIEREIMRSRLRVFERPPFKFMEETESTAQPAGAPAKSETRTHGTKTERTVDVVAMYSDSKADYIVVTYLDNKRLRIVKREDRSVVGTAEVPDQRELGTYVLTALVDAGFVASPFQERECPMITRERTSPYESGAQAGNPNSPYGPNYPAQPIFGGSK